MIPRVGGYRTQYAMPSMHIERELQRTGKVRGLSSQDGMYVGECGKRYRFPLSSFHILSVEVLLESIVTVVSCG